MPGKIAVIGGANMDIGGFPAGALVAGDSNPGKVRMSVGGVGRNIAENLVRLGLEVELFTAVGEDANGRAILEDCRLKGIACPAVRILPEEGTSVYLFIDDAQGDMNVAINDMNIQKQITPDYLAAHLERINAMDAVVIDANLNPETIAWLAEHVQPPMFADAVSAAKVARLRPALHRLQGFKPNRLEAELLTGMQIRDAVDASRAAQQLLDMGVKQVYLSLGVQGAVCADGGQCIYLPGAKAAMANASGAGDAFTAALVWAFCEGLSLRESGIAGMAAAAIAVGSISAVNPEMCARRLRTGMQVLAENMN